MIETRFLYHPSFYNSQNQFITPNSHNSQKNHQPCTQAFTTLKTNSSLLTLKTLKKIINYPSFYNSQNQFITPNSQNSQKNHKPSKLLQLSKPIYEYRLSVQSITYNLDDIVSFTQIRLTNWLQLLIIYRIKHFFKSDSEIFLTLKNGLEAGSLIFNIYGGRVG